MKIVVLIPEEENELHALNMIEQGVKNLAPNFNWEAVYTEEDFFSQISSFKIAAKEIEPNESSDQIKSSVSLSWPRPTKIVKDLKTKERVWTEIQEQVLPIFKTRPAVEVPSLKLTSLELQDLLKTVASSAASFTLRSSAGFVVGVNLDENAKVDLSLTSADISSMLAASWVFGSSGVQIPKAIDARRNHTS